MNRKHLFYFPYFGGKSKELKYIYPLFNIDQFETIVEPFCGSCIFSTSLYRNHPEKQYVMNDNDNILINFLSDVKQNGSSKYINFCADNWTKGETTREQYNAICANKNTDLTSWFYRRKIYNIRIGMYPTSSTIRVVKDDTSYNELDDFFKSENVTLSCDDYKNVIEKYKDDEKCLMFLDPPYFLSYNDCYKTKGKDFNLSMSKETYFDPTESYKYMRNALEKYKCKIILSINENSLLKDYYQQFFKTSYNVKYQVTKKLNRHMILSNL